MNYLDSFTNSSEIATFLEKLEQVIISSKISNQKFNKKEPSSQNSAPVLFVTISFALLGLILIVLFLQKKAKKLK